MKNFYMILAALLIGSMCFAQFSPRQAYKAGTPSTAAVRSSYIGNLSFDQVFYPMSNGEEIAIAPKQYNSSLTGNITKVKFYHHTEDSYTNTSYTIKIYNNISLGGAYTSFGYYDETSCGTAAYTQNYTASENGWQEVELETPYVVPSGEFWVSIQFNGNGIACFGGAASAVEGQYYMKTAVSTYGTFWFAPSLAQQGSSEATLYSCCLAVYVDGQSDLEALFLTDASGSTIASSTMNLAEGQDLVLYPAIANMGPDPTDGTITAIIKIDNETLTSSPISQSIPAGQAIILQEQGSNSFTIPSDYLPETNFNICLVIEYAGTDPNTENNTTCINITRYHSINVYSNNENMGYVSGGGDFIHGTETSISATPYTGYRFVRWNDNNTDNPRTITVTGNASYTAYFEPIAQCDLTAMLFTDAQGSTLVGSTMTLTETQDFIVYPAIGNYGPDAASVGTITIYITLNGTNIIQPQSFNLSEQLYIPAGSAISITQNGLQMTAAEMDQSGFIGTFEVCFSIIYSDNDPNTANNTVCVTVTRLTYHSINVYSNNENMGYVSGGGDFIYGTETSISATPYTGYRFVRWNDNNTDNPRTITVTGDASYTAYFEAIPQYTINVIPSPSSYGYTNGNGTYYEGTEITISATAYDGYRFSYWSDGNTNSTRTITVTGNVTYTAYFEINSEQYNIDVYSANPDYGYTYGGGTYYEGSSITIGATAYSGYRFSNWQDSNTDNPRTITVTGNANYVANFEAIPQYTINVNPSNPNFGYTYGSGTYYEGAEITIWAEAYSGYRFIGWNDGNTNATRTITVTGNATYTAIFEEIPQYTITVRPSNPNYGTTWGGGTYTEGTEITFGVDPYDGYRFIGWNDGDTNTTRTIIVTENAVYTAILEEIPPQFTITVISSNPEYGTVFGGGTFERGTLISISAEAYDGYIFTSWNDNNTMNPRTVEVVADATFIANFSDITTVNTYTITVLSANPEYGTVSGGGTYAEGTVITITAEPNEGYEFVQWNDDVTRNPRMIGVTADATFIATFAELPPEPENYTINVYTSNPEQGSVTGGGTFVEGTEITIEAIPNNGFIFTSWDDGNLENPRRITVVGNAEYTALFADITTVNTYTITVYSSNPNYGSVAGEGTYAEGTIVTISASANNGYMFKQWNDGNMENPRQITVVADATYIATFVRGSAIEESYANEISIFPNPTSDILNITSSEEISSIEIVNVIGQIVLRMDVNSDNAACNVEAINAGVYIVRIYGTNTASVICQRKFIKE